MSSKHHHIEMCAYCGNPAVQILPDEFDRTKCIGLCRKHATTAFQLEQMRAAFTALGHVITKQLGVKLRDDQAHVVGYALVAGWIITIIVVVYVIASAVIR